MRTWILAALLLCALPSPARSQTIEITPMAGYRFGGTLYSFGTMDGGTPSAALKVGDGPCGSSQGCGGQVDSRDLSQGEGRAGLILRF